MRFGFKRLASSITSKLHFYLLNTLHFLISVFSSWLSLSLVPFAHINFLYLFCHFI